MITCSGYKVFKTMVEIHHDISKEWYAEFHFIIDDDKKFFMRDFGPYRQAAVRSAKKIVKNKYPEIILPNVPAAWERA